MKPTGDDVYFLQNYCLFLLKTATVVAALLVIALGLVAILSRGKTPRHKPNVKKLNQYYEEVSDCLHQKIFSKEQYKHYLKTQKKAKKHAEQSSESKKRIFVIQFDGDIKASAVESLREEITAVLTIAKPTDEVIVRIESSGGLVHTYGLAASQLCRIKDRGIPLTIAVDKVAASGGYLMACVANQILAAPFAIIGSIGVIAQLPNFNRFLKKNHIDFEQLTAGEFKRTLTLFGENTERSRQKFQQDLENTHSLFKHFIITHRPMVNITEVATGEFWYATQAIEWKLVDRLITSDDYLLEASKTADLYEVKYPIKKSLSERLSFTAVTLLRRLTNSQGNLLN